jgi:hypothetical protein
MLLRATGAGDAPAAPEVDGPELTAPIADSKPGRSP